MDYSFLCSFSWRCKSCFRNNDYPLLSGSSSAPKIKQPPTTVSIIVIIGLFIFSIILTPISFAVGRASSQEPTPTPNIQTPTLATTLTATTAPTPTATAPVLYQVDFSQGSQGWLDSSHSQQWTYNATGKVLESDGSLPCCSLSTLVNIVLVAPYKPTVSDYVIEAQMKITGLNQNHSYNNDQPPFFGLYVRGDDVNGQGYMAGIGWIYGTPNGKATAKGPLSYLVALGPNPQFYNSVDTGAETYGLDTGWHTYRFEVTGNSFMLKIDNKPVYSHPIHDNLFSSGPRVGLEDYNCLLQVKSFTVFPLKTTSENT